VIKAKKIGAYGYGLSAVLLWSTVATAFKLGLKHFTPTELLFISNLVSVMVLFVLGYTTKRSELKSGLTGKNFYRSMLSGFINPFLYYIILFKGYSLLPAQVAQPVNFLWPVILSLFSALFLNQKLDLKSIIALFLSFLGAFVVVSQGKFGKITVEHPSGIIFCLLSTILWSAFWIFNLKDTRVAVVRLFYSFLFAQVYLTILFMVKGGFPNILRLETLYPVYIGLFEMSITFYLWMKALEMSERTVKMNILIYLAPVISVVFIHLVLKEEIYFTSLAGLLIILSGILVQMIKKAR
jgi:drug/metabolite transporter (DMT)-like permease